MEKLSYALGMIIGQNLKQMGVSGVQSADFAKAVTDVLEGHDTALTGSEAQQLVQDFLQKKEAEAGKAARQAGEDFLKANATKEGVVVLPSGLQYSVITEGKGARPRATDKVKGHYEGTLRGGTGFDSGYRRGEPATFPLNGVIAGWTEGVQLIAEGSKYRFYIPYNRAYVSRGGGASIPPYAALIFDVELIEIVK